MDFVSDLSKELSSKLYARRIPFSAFNMGGSDASISVMLQSPAGQLTMPFALHFDGHSYRICSTKTCVAVTSITMAISWLVKEVRKMETRLGKYRL